MSKDHTEFMKEAIRLSVANVEEGKGGPFGAVIVKDGKIIARGVNQVTSSNDPTAHAEVVAIRMACQALNSFQLGGCEIYTSCEPCPMCLGAIYWARIVKIYYASTRTDAALAGFDDAHLYDELNAPQKRRSIPCEQLLQHQAGEALRLWLDTVNRVAY